MRGPSRVAFGDDREVADGAPGVHGIGDQVIFPKRFEPLATRDRLDDPLRLLRRLWDNPRLVQDVANAALA